jgi:hypothetical protein
MPGQTKNDTKNKIEDTDKCFVRVKEFDIENGGIYLETTDDPRGWMLGDKTRKIYQTTLGRVFLTTNLLILVAPQGDEVIVRVCNPKEISRMLLSENDDVGSSVKYADIDDPNGVVLIAGPGRHVCIESMTNGGWIRVNIFPGKDLMKFDNEKMEDALKRCKEM